MTFEVLCVSFLGMDKQLVIFNFIRMEVGTVNVKQLGKAFNLDDDPKGVVEEYNSLFLE